MPLFKRDAETEGLSSIEVVLSRVGELRRNAELLKIDKEEMNDQLLEFARTVKHVNNGKDLSDIGKKSYDIINELCKELLKISAETDASKIDFTLLFHKMAKFCNPSGKTSVDMQSRVILRF